MSSIDTDFVDYYDELSLSKEFSTIEIRKKLHEQKYQWQSRASRAGSHSEKARQKIAVIEKAETVFADEESREQYDLELARRNRVEAPDNSEEVDWLGRAWSYYFMDDEGAAFVAARKAREQKPQSPLSFVVSAWVAIQQDEFRQAKGFADEAFVIDELGEDTTDVHHVRGVVFALNQDYERAINSYDRALKTASGIEASEINWRKIKVYIETKKYAEAVNLIEEALKLVENMSTDAGTRQFNTCAQAAALYGTQGIEEFNAAQNSNFKGVKRYEALISKARGFLIAEDLKESFIAELKAQRKVLASYINYMSEKAQLEQKESPGSDYDMPGFPIKSIALTIFSLMIAISSGSSGGLFVVIAFAVGLFAFYQIMRRNAWENQRKEFQSAQNRIGELIGKLEDLKTKIQEISMGNPLTTQNATLS